MTSRLLAITTGGLPGVTITALCAELGISRKTYYEWRNRFDKEGPAGLEPRSRRPLLSPNQVPAVIEQLIVRLREQLPLDNGALAIFYQMQRDGVVPLPSPRTIHRVLVRNGLVAPQPKKRPRSSWVRFEYDNPNECWQIDATQWELRDGRIAWIMDVLDDHSRYMPAADAVLSDTAEAAWKAICHAADEIGLPAKVLSDNGLCFTGGGTGPGTFITNLAALGIVKANSRPYHPQTCGKLERAHQTLKKWLAKNLGPEPWPNSNANSTPSAPTTTTTDHTEPCAAPPPPNASPPKPKPNPPAYRSTCRAHQHCASANAPCNPTASSPPAANSSTSAPHGPAAPSP